MGRSNIFTIDRYFSSETEKKMMTLEDFHDGMEKIPETAIEGCGGQERRNIG